MKNFINIFFYILACTFSVNSSIAQKSAGLQRIIIIRHGEKPDKGDNLSCQGLNRAMKLMDVLHQKVGTPDYIYVPAINTGKATSTARMYQTIIPFAVKYNLEINTKFDVKDAEGLVHSVRKKSGTVLLVWEHKQIKNILKSLGIANPSNWDDNDFDSMYIITFPRGTATITKDKENITPVAACN